MITIIICFILFLLTGIKTIREQMVKMAYNELKATKNLSQNKKKNIDLNKFKKEIFSSQKERKNKINLHKTIKIQRKKNKCSSSIKTINHKSRNKISPTNIYNKKKKITNHNSKDLLKYSFNLNLKESKKNIKELIDNKCKVKNKEKIKNYSEYELDDLEYAEAIIYDKRTFLNYYICLIKREHLLIFTFFYCKDFNLISIKLSLFVFSICLDMTTNILFFNDESMHKIYVDYGKYNFVSQIPQIVYSTIISESMDQLLKYLSLSEKEIYEVKKYKNIKEVADGIKKLIKCLKIKFFFFFLVCFIFMIFFWYSISIFCAVYENTQIILFKDSSMSFLSSMFYPFALYLLPSTLRITSLRSIKKNKKILFKISNFIPLF